MNSAKKIMNQQKETKKEKHASAAKGKVTVSRGTGDVKKIVFSVICIVVALALCIGVGIQQFQPKTVLTVNGTKMSMDDLMYPIYERESQYLLYDEMYQYYTGSSVWENSYMGSDRNVDSSLTNSQGLKQEVINAETEYEILYQEAKKAGYTLTDDEKADVEEQVSEALKGLSFTQKLKLDISKGKLKTRFEKRALADKYKADQQETLNKDVDEDKAIADISKKEYRQYDIQYYSASLTKTTKSGNTKDISAKKKKELLEKMEALARKTETKFEDQLDEDEEDITYEETDFTEKDGWSMVSDKKILKEIKAMDNGEVSQIYEDEDSGYYLLVKMVDNNSSESYDAACEEAITEAQNEAYDTWYQELKDTYKVSLNTTIWDDVVIGTVTTDIVTAEDLQDMQEDSSDNASS